MGGLGAPELIIILFMLVLPAVVIWGIVAAARRPDRAWTQLARTRPFGSSFRRWGSCSVALARCCRPST